MGGIEEVDEGAGAAWVASSDGSDGSDGSGTGLVRVSSSMADILGVGRFLTIIDDVGLRIDIPSVPKTLFPDLRRT